MERRRNYETDHYKRANYKVPETIRGRTPGYGVHDRCRRNRRERNKSRHRAADRDLRGYDKPETRCGSSERSSAPGTSERTSTSSSKGTSPKERLEFGDKRVQQIVRRMEKNPEKAADIMQQTLIYFEPSEQVLNVLKLAAKIV